MRGPKDLISNSLVTKRYYLRALATIFDRTRTQFVWRKEKSRDASTSLGMTIPARPCRFERPWLQDKKPTLSAIKSTYDRTQNIGIDPPSANVIDTKQKRQPELGAASLQT
jgi:hypothetical protein